MRRALLAMCLVAAVAPAASAHPLDLGYLTIERTPGGLALHLELDRGAAAAVLGVDAATLDAPTVAVRAGDLALRTYARAPITGCRFTTSFDATLTGRTIRISGAATCDATAHQWTFPLVHDQIISPRFQLMVKDTMAGSERLTLVDKASGPLDLDATPTTSSSVHVTTFIGSGIEHIGVAPGQWRDDDGGLKLPDGIDHILFLLALMLGGGTLLQMIGIASGFTLGHSITLALAALDVVRPPASIIEPLIALSIALAALEALWAPAKLKHHRWKIAAGFGLIHGFGFATALTHLELTTRGKVTALFGYNLGVEVGQITIVLLAAPLVLLAHRTSHPAGRHALRVAAALVFAAGLYWFAQRVGVLA